MIRLHGAARRAFHFPAEAAVARAHYEDFRRVLTWLPHLKLVKVYDAARFRVLYHSTELGVYDVRIYCDLYAAFDAEGRVLRVRPYGDPAPVRSRVTATSLTAQGRYESDSRLLPTGAGTRIDYQLRLSAALPKPLGLQLMPDAVVEQIAHRIVNWRIREIADGFVARSLAVYAGDRR